MAVIIDLQNDKALVGVPAIGELQRWVQTALQTSYDKFEQSIRIVAMAESRDLNRRFRGKDAATNVLAFPGEADFLDYDCLGDIVICAPLVISEAQAQGKAPLAHWAHLVVHGMLHLQGYDHADAATAATMETLEIKILDSLGFSNPYND